MSNLDKVSAWRKFKNYIAKFCLLLLFVAAVFPLAMVFWHVVSSGISAVSFEFLTTLPASIGQPGGGIANAIVGSATMILIACLGAVPIGIMAGLFLTEYPKIWLTSVLRFVIDLMSSIPSIVVGLYVYSVIVVPMKGFSAYAGAFSLGLLMLPIIVKSTEQVLLLIPESVREAGLALGIPRWRVIISIILMGSIPELMTGVLLAVARVTGETAPLLFTAFGNRYWPASLSQPTASLPTQIYSFAISPFKDWHRQAWGAAFVLMMTVFLFNLFARYLVVRRSVKKS